MAQSAAGSSNAAEFNKGIILPTLIRQLQSILQQYPDDGQILKELIQNAEDAGAERTVFLLDHTTYSHREGMLHHSGLALYQGPALYVYNDAVFTDADWHGIRLLSDSVKQNDPMKVGRFGLGFKSLFHMTDLPSIFSGCGIGFIDPHELFFKTEGPRSYPTSSYMWDLVTNREDILCRLSDQFDPFIQPLFGVTAETFEAGYFDGTIFRFPLRTADAASDLCQTVYSTQKVKDLFHLLEADAHDLLLFLKNLKAVEVYEKLSNDSPPRMLMTFCVSPDTDKLVTDKRAELIKRIADQRSASCPTPVSVTFPMTTELTLHQQPEPEVTVKNWVVSHFHGCSVELSDSSGLLPWVAAAVQVQETAYEDSPQGHVFCFLPLPRELESPTGLRVHVHGYFAVDQNRRHIKARVIEQMAEKITDQDILWNEYLISSLVPKAFVSLVRYVAESYSAESEFVRRNLIYSIIPDMETVTLHWKPLATAFREELPTLSIFYSATSGQFMLIKDVLFDEIEDSSCLTELVRRILSLNQTDLVSAPSYIVKQLASDAPRASAVLVCKALKNMEPNVSLTDDDRMLLLKYFVDYLASDRAELVGAKLLPLADNTWIDFRRPTVEDCIYIDSDEHSRSFLPGLDNFFVRSDAVKLCDTILSMATPKTTQLTRLDPSAVAKLIRSRLFSSSQQHSEEINMADYNLSESWVENIWRYIERYFPDVSVFEDLHVLPSGTGKLTKMLANSPVIVLKHNNNALPDTVQNVCKTVGVRLIDTLASPALSNHKAVWGKYILKPDVCGLMTALSHLNNDQLLARFVSLSAESKKQFLEYIANAMTNNDTALNTGRSLLHVVPMFSTLDGSGFQPSHFTSLTAVPRAAPATAIPVRYPECLLDTSSPSVHQLLVKLNVKILSLSEAVTHVVFPAVNDNVYSHEQVSEVMQFICDRWSAFDRSEPFMGRMKSLRFVARHDGELLAPRELFCPHDTRLKTIFYGQDVFPVGVFAQASYSYALDQLGLKGRQSVTATDICDIASRLSATTYCDSDVESTLQCANELLSFLEDHCDLLQGSVPSHGDSLLNVLKQISWVPILRCRPDRYPKQLSFHGESSGLFSSPSCISSPEHSFLVGSVVPCLGVPVHGIQKLAAKFDWTRQPSLEDTIQHLLNVVDVCENLEFVDLDFECTVNDSYAYLNHHTHELSAFVSRLSDSKWIVCENGFAKIEQVVLRKPFTDLRPHVFVLQPEYQKYLNLWNTVGIADSCDLVAVLRSIAALHNGRTVSQDEVRRDLQYAINILNEVAESRDVHEYRSSLLVPVDTSDGRLRMLPVDECTYCDKEWYQQGFDISDVTTDVHLVHHRMPSSTAEALHIHSIVSRVLNVEELGMTSYGQSEPLTRRLRNLLKDYTDGLAVIKELIQNADDAGATEVRFLYDERRNDGARTKLLDAGMKELQGPALWVYNNATFTATDFDNLVKLSGATKEHCKDKIGKFGVGFNAVYNLTDLPAVMSRNYIVYLDPHTKYLNQVIRNKNNPGIKIDLNLGRRSLSCFCDQFKPFAGIFGCDLSSSADAIEYNATLFRLPLRTAEQSASSDICNKYYSHQEMMNLLSTLLKSADHLLLFSQNVKTVSVCHLSADDEPTNMQELYCITKTVERVFRSPDVPNLTNHCAILHMASNALKMGSSAKVESSLLLRIDTNIAETAVQLLTVDGKKSRATHWLVSSCMGQHESFQMSVTSPDLIAVGGVATQLDKCDDGFCSSCKNGIIFCFFPLPFTKSTELPVHINGQFAVASSRMHLIERTANDKVDDRAVWNELLMKDAVKLAYINLLQDVLVLCGASESFLLWPLHKHAVESGILSCLTDSLYTDLSKDQGPKVCKVNGRHVSLIDCRMLEADFREGDIGHAALQVLSALAIATNAGFEVIDLPVQLLRSMLQTSAKQTLQKLMISKQEFYLHWFLPNIANTDIAVCSQLVLAALFDTDIGMSLCNYECIPTWPDGKLKKPCDLIHPESDLAVLFDEEEERFPFWGFQHDEKYQQSDIYRNLISIGLQHNDLSWQELSHRCAKVAAKHDKRLAPVINLMSKKARCTSSEDMCYVEEIKKKQFLPVYTKPHDLPLPWNGDEHGKFTSCEEAYLSNVQNLVCCTHPVIDEHATFSWVDIDLKKLLNLTHKPIPVSAVLQQLDCVVSHCSEQSNSTSFRKLEKVCEDVYSFLNKELTKTNCEQQLRNELSKKECIFVANKSVFMRPSQCAKRFPVVASEALLPFLYQIPSRMYEGFCGLFDAIGVKECFDAADYIGILQRIHEDSLNVPLAENDLKVALEVINNCLTTCTTVPEDAQIYLPNVDGIMCTADSLCFNNCQWITVSDINLCHPMVPYEAANKLRVKTIKQDYFMKNSIGIPFGQKEKLATRIRRILMGYPFDKAILKEMLQNADDAGATELHFINDERQLPTERLFEESWKPLQGPALCVYNNKPFTEKDIAGIQSLGEGSKKDDPVKTGQYGIGFNSVYHVTDVPSVLTYVNNEQVLCCFDPNCRFVPGATADSPGRKLSNIPELQAKFPDVFQGYYNCEYGEEQGTLFRLPLRNSGIAGESEISDKPVTSKHVENLFTEFKEDMYMPLLFLNSVKKVCLKKVDASSGFQTLYTVSAELTMEAAEKREQFKMLVKETAKQLNDSKQLLKDVAVQEVSYRMTTVDSSGRSDEWIIVQRLGFENPSHVPECVSFAHKSRDLVLLPRGSVACPIDGSGKHGHGQLFCFLPLPIQLQTPVSINGQFALDYETRRNLWRGEKADYKTEWNNCLMAKIVAPAYCTLMTCMQQVTLTSEQLENYWPLFLPVADYGDSYILQLSIAVYRHLEHMTVLPIRNVDSANDQDRYLWIKPVEDGATKGFFDDLNSQIGMEESAVREVATEEMRREKTCEVIREVLNNCGFKLFLCPMDIYSQFQMADVPVNQVTPLAVLEFFSSFGREDTGCRVTDVDVPVSRTLFKDIPTLCKLLLYCTRATEYTKWLNGCPLLVTSDEHLRVFDTGAVRFEPYFAHVLPHIPEQFFHRAVFSVLQTCARSDPQLCRILDVERFATELDHILPCDVFYGAQQRVAFSELVNFLQNPTRWLHGVWDFLRSHAGSSPQRIRAVLQPLAEWCIVPAASNSGQCELVPVLKAPCILPPAVNSLDVSLNTVFCKLGVLRPMLFSKDERVIDFYWTVLCSLQSPVSVIVALEEAAHHNRVTANLTMCESEELLAYFVKHFGVLNGAPNSIPTIQKLPMFCTVYNKLVSIEDCCVYVLPADIPTVDMEAWSATHGLVFLKGNHSTTELFTFLGCQHLTDTEVYCSFIFEHFEMLSPDGRYRHLMYVRDKLLPRIRRKPASSYELDTLMGSLRKLRFIPRTGCVENRELAIASEFYDDSVELFRAMHETTDFVPQPYCDTPQWRSFLQECGIIQEVSQQMFLQYAKHVANSGIYEISEETAKQSYTLLKHLFVCREQLSHPQFLHQLRSIPFIVPHSVGCVKENLYVQYGKRNSSGCLQLVAFEGSISSNWTNAVWSVQPIISHSIFAAVPGMHVTNSCCHLKVDQKPKLQNVAQHIQLLCTSLVSTTRQKTTTEVNVLSSALKFIYNMLQREDLPDAVVAMLSSSPCVFDTERRLLVKPQQVVVRMTEEDEIEPYLVVLPLDLGPYSTLFCKLGSSASLTVNQFVMVLEAVYTESDHEELHPNEMTAVHKAMKGFFTSLKSLQQYVPVNGLPNLYLLGRDNKMHESSTLIVCDLRATGAVADLNEPLLVSLEACNINISGTETSKLFAKLPAELQPQFLSAAVSETMEYEDVVECKLAQSLSAKLQSQEFREAIVRLMLHSTEKDREDTDVDHATETAGRLETIRVVGVNNLKTYLTFKGEKLQGTESSPFYCKQCENSGGTTEWVMYFCVSEQREEKKIHKAVCCKLCDLISKVVDSNLQTSSALVSSLLTCSPNEEHEQLDMCGIERLTETVGRQETNQTVPGKFVPVTLHHLLRQDMFSMKPGDYAALEKYDPAENDEPGEPTYIFVHIAEKNTCDSAAGPFSVQYKVDVGGGIEQVMPGTLLYAFARQSTAGRDGSEVDDKETVDYDGVIDSLKITLTDAWHMEQSDRRKILKRLIHQWHPGSQSKNAELAKKVTKFIITAADRLDHGLPLSDSNASGTAASLHVPPASVPVVVADTSGSSINFCRSYYNYMSERTTQHRQHQQAYQRNYEQNTYQVVERQKENFFGSFLSGINPQPGEGRRWLRQAEVDVRATTNDENGSTAAYEWACYKCYKGAVKALRGAQYARDANREFPSLCDVRPLTKHLDDDSLTSWADELHRLVKSPEHLQYPAQHSAMKIPSDVFTQAMAQSARALSTSIICSCEAFINNRRLTVLADSS